MAGTLAIVALVASALLLGTMILALVLLRKGEGPSYSASEAYDAHRREALRRLTGVEPAAVPGDQWYAPAFEHAAAGAEWIGELRDAAREALRVVVPEESGLTFDPDGRPRLAGEESDLRILVAVSTAALREDPVLEADDEAAPVVGLVLFNPEPPGGQATRVTLPIQVLFPALEREGRDDLIRRFEALRERVSTQTTTPQGGDER